MIKDYEQFVNRHRNHWDEIDGIWYAVRSFLKKKLPDVNNLLLNRSFISIAEGLQYGTEPAVVIGLQAMPG